MSKGITKAEVLRFSLALIAAGLLPAIYAVAVSSWGEARTKELVQWALQAQEKYEASTNAPPIVDQRPESPHNPMHNAADEQFFRELKWLRTDTWGPNARVTKRMDLVSISRNGMRYKADDLADWKAAELVGVMCIAVNRGGRWEGGKFDHVRANTKDRDFKNVCGYINVCPKSGEVVRFWLLSYDGRQASNYVETRWP